MPGDQHWVQVVRGDGTGLAWSGGWPGMVPQTLLGHVGESCREALSGVAGSGVRATTIASARESA